MAKRRLICAVLLSLPLLMFGQSIEEFDSIVNFDATLKELYLAAMTGNVDGLPMEFVLIDGAVSEREVLIADADEFLGQMVLVSGEWLGVEEVLKYQCVVLLDGRQFANTIPVRRTREPHPEEIVLNSRIMVLGKVLGIVEWDHDELIPVIQAFRIRKID